ncbi:hypothetical protein ACCO45_007053 [Purpureocillium lilacinum]|uniref:Uncharacterized protein n=1 Tax=Purpureocillium lilacinum TaxID=33203 RepID=A0ACC4DR94_PURLI
MPGTGVEARWRAGPPRRHATATVEKQTDSIDNERRRSPADPPPSPAALTPSLVLCCSLRIGGLGEMCGPGPGGGGRGSGPVRPVLGLAPAKGRLRLASQHETALRSDMRAHACTIVAARGPSV